MDTLTHIASEEDHGLRLDKILARAFPDLSRTRIKSLILDGAVHQGGRTICEPRYVVKSGEELTVSVPPAAPADPQPQDIPLDILFEDHSIVVINKPAGLIAHPGAGHPDGTLVNALLAHCGQSLSGIGGVKRPGIVHRLDKDTSGVMVVAKSDAAHRALSAQFEDHGRTGPLSRRYEALVWGVPTLPAGRIDQPIGRSPTNPLKFTVRKDGKEAITHFKVLDRYHSKDGTPLASRIACELETGRTHQIRVHMAHMSHPVIADPVYGAGFATRSSRLPPEPARAYSKLNRQALHAEKLQIGHPETGDVLSFHAPLPDDLADLKHALDRESP